MNYDYDAVIVGAGIIGQALALGLGMQGFDVALIEASDEPKLDNLNENEFSSRVSAISSSSQRLLTELGAWQNIARMQEYTKMEVSDQDGFGGISFNKQELLDNINASALVGQQPSLGHIIENNVINDALFQSISNLPNVTCFFNASVKGMDTNYVSANVVLQLPSSSKNSQANEPEFKSLSTKLLVGADGANSRVRGSLGFKYTFNDYDHTAIVFNVQTSNPHNQVAKQVFTPYGPLAFLPLANSHQCSVVFSQQNERAAELMAMDESEFSKLLRVTIDNYYGECKLVTKRSSFPLRMRYAKSWIKPHIVILGDAAHTIHPLAGQGANLGLGDVKYLLDLIKHNPDKFGSYYQLRQFERSRKAEAVKVIATMQGFKELFDGSNPIKRLVRNTGLLVASNASPLKSFFIKQAMGS